MAIILISSDSSTKKVSQKQQQVQQDEIDYTQIPFEYTDGEYELDLEEFSDNQHQELQQEEIQQQIYEQQPEDNQQQITEDEKVVDGEDIQEEGTLFMLQDTTDDDPYANQTQSSPQPTAYTSSVRQHKAYSHQPSQYASSAASAKARSTQQQIKQKIAQYKKQAQTAQLQQQTGSYQTRPTAQYAKQAPVEVQQKKYKVVRAPITDKIPITSQFQKKTKLKPGHYAVPPQPPSARAYNASSSDPANSGSNLFTGSGDPPNSGSNLFTGSGDPPNSGSNLFTGSGDPAYSGSGNTSSTDPVDPVDPPTAGHGNDPARQDPVNPDPPVGDIYNGTEPPDLGELQSNPNQLPPPASGPHQAHKKITQAKAGKQYP